VTTITDRGSKLGSSFSAKFAYVAGMMNQRTIIYGAVENTQKEAAAVTETKAVTTPIWPRHSSSG
jgi:hypothetical protein